MLFFAKHKRGVLITGGVVVGALLVVGLVISSLLDSGALRLSQNGVATSTGGSAAYDTDEGMKGGVGTPPMAPSYEEGRDMAVSDTSYPYQPQPTAGETAAEVDQRIIKTGALRLTVDKVSDAIAQISALAVERKGFVQSSSSSERYDGKHEGVIVVRVPSADFESTMLAIKAKAKVVNDESSQGQDVTEQFSDLQAQLRNAQAQEAEYLRIMKQAKDVQDILAVQQQLGYVRGQIESLQGRIKYLENVTSYSTIEVYLSEEVSVTVPTKEFRPGSIVKQATQALINLAQDTVAALIWLVIVGGGIAVPVLLLVLIVRAILRARASRGKR